MMMGFLFQVGAVVLNAAIGEERGKHLVTEVYCGLGRISEMKYDNFWMRN